MTTNEVETLLSAMNELSGHVKTLGEHLTVSDQQTRWLRRLNLALAAVVLIGFMFGGYQWNRISNAVEQNKTTQTNACRNGNEARAANLALWQFVLAASAQQNGGSPLSAAFEDWIKKLYAPHDCEHLDKVYEIPPPPTLPSPSSTPSSTQGGSQ